MANYLERVASSASRRAAVARPPGSGPPLLPVGREPSLPPEGLFASEDDQVFEGGSPVKSEMREPSRTPSDLPTVRPSLSRPKERPQVESKVADARSEPVSRVEPSPKTEVLSTESPFTIHLPKTLRPVTPESVPQAVTSEPSRERAASTPSIVHGESERVVSSSLDQVEVERPHAKAQLSEPQTPAHPPLRSDSVVTETPVIRPAVPDEKAKQIQTDSSSHRSEPLPAAVSPVQVPVVVGGGATRQEPSRISIGSLEVLVNNGPPPRPVRTPASAPARGEGLSLEKRYLDRFRLRH